MSTVFPVRLIRRGIPTDELLADVRAVAARLQASQLSMHRYDELGKFNATTITRRLGSWKAALRQLGLAPAHLFHVRTFALLRDLRRVAERLGTPTLLISQYRVHGRFTPDTIRKRFGSWHHGMQAAGLIPVHCHLLTDEELFDNLKQVWQKLNRQPRIADLHRPLSLCTVGPYLTRFGSWCNALRAFDAHLHPKLENAPIVPRCRPRVSSHINWRLRYQILQRDHFRCQACGGSPANDPTVKLQIDHKHPRSQGGSSTADNLQTLCERCNSGKGDLSNAKIA